MIIRKRTIYWALTVFGLMGVLFFVMVATASGNEPDSGIHMTQRALIGWIGLAMTVIGGWTTILVGVIGWALNRFIHQISGKIDKIQENQREEEERRRKTEKEMAQMNGKYVSTDQCGNIKGEINKKLDRVHDRIDELHKWLAAKQDKESVKSRHRSDL